MVEYYQIFIVILTYEGQSESSDNGLITFCLLSYDYEISHTGATQIKLRLKHARAPYNVTSFARS